MTDTIRIEVKAHDAANIVFQFQKGVSGITDTEVIGTAKHKNGRNNFIFTIVDGVGRCHADLDGNPACIWIGSTAFNVSHADARRIAELLDMRIVQEQQ